MVENTDVVPFERLAIIGVGLIGGSLGMAAKAKGLARRVIGLGRDRNKLMRAQQLAAIDEFSLDLRNGVRNCDCVIVCTPVQTIVPTIEKIGPYLDRGCIVTDVGSTKSEVTEAAEKVLPTDCAFIGGHPMAGSEMSGVEAAVPYLFLNATYVITPTENTHISALNRIVTFAEALGANVALMSPDRHDRCASIISHIPHILSACILHLAAQERGKAGEIFNMAAGSFRDMTRVASSPPELWRDVLLTNKQAIYETLSQFESLLVQTRELIAAGDEESIERLFSEAKSIKEHYIKSKNE